MQKLSLLLYFIYCIAFVHGRVEPFITYIEPRLGSLNGVTRVTLFGSGFATDLNLGDPTPTKEVYLVTSYSEFPCNVHDAESDENQVVCYTVAMPVSNYQIRMKQNGVWLQQSQYCGRSFNSWYCRFHTRISRTPLIASVLPSTGEPHRFLTVDGTLYTNLTGATEAAASNGLNIAITRAYLTSGLCQLYNESNQLPYRISLDGVEGTSIHGEFDCLIESSYVGYQNLSFIVDGDYGRSLTRLIQLRVSWTNRIYMIDTYAVITDVYPKTGSLNGGALLSISGRNFDPIDTKVYVGGEVCTVVNVTDFLITCQTPAKPMDKKAYSGGRGIKVEVFPSIRELTDFFDTSSSGYYAFYAEEAYLGRDIIDGNNLVTRARGIFVPNVDANYVFSVFADDQMELYFNSNGTDPNEATLVTFIYRAYRYNYAESIYLSSGRQYYYELRHKNFGGPLFFQLGVHVDKTAYLPKHTARAKSEEQEITISSVVEKEQHRVTFMNWTLEESREPVFELNTSCLMNDSSICYRSGFSVTLFSVSSKLLYYGITGNELKSVIEEMNVIDDEVDLTVTDAYSYLIRFRTTKGQPVFSVKNVDDSKISISLTEKIVGIPKLDTYAFELNGFISSSLEVDASESEVEAAIMAMYAPKCPDEIEAQIGRIKEYYDLETDSFPSGTRSEFKSFCGSYSLLNPLDLYNGISYQTSTFKHICFAYTGDIEDRLVILYSYVEDGVSGPIRITSNNGHIRDVGLTDSYGQWTHFCININDRLQSERPNGRSFQITLIRVFGGSDANEDLYLDNIFIGDLRFTETQDAVSRIIPSAVPHIRLLSVDVSKSGNHLNITYGPIDCGHDFPLLGFAFANDSFDISSDKMEYRFGRGESKIFVERVGTASPPITGTFDITFSDPSYRQLEGIKANSSESIVKNELETLLQVDRVEVQRSGTCYGYTWSVTFESPGGTYPLMEPENVDLYSEPGNASIDVTRLVTGGLTLTPIPGDFLRIAYDEPQVEVFVNSIPSKCAADFDGDNQTSCQFNWLESSTPNIDDVSVVTSAARKKRNVASAGAGDWINIAGTGFSIALSDIQIFVGGVECVVISSTMYEIVCVLGNSPTGTQKIVINVFPFGFGSANMSQNDLEIAGSIDSISPTNGSVHGCQVVTITGKGFEASSTVSIGGSSCNVIEASYNEITCQTTAASVGIADVEVTTAGTTVMSASLFEYVDTGIGAATTLSQTMLQVDGGTLTITGSGFGEISGEVYFADFPIENINSWSDNEINLEYPSLPPSSYDVIVIVPVTGCAESSLAVSYSFSVTDVQPNIGSLLGGTKVVLSGTGFSSNTVVSFGDIGCEVSSFTNDGTSIMCETKSTSQTHVITNSGVHPTFGIGYAWNPSTLDVVSGDKVLFVWSYPILVTGQEIGLFTTSDASSMVYDENGFEIPPSQSGRYTFSFNTPGTVYFASGCVVSDCQVFMRGVLNVAEATPITKTLSVTTNSIEALYAPSAFTFTFDDGHTPKVNSISPRNGTTNTIVNIEGSGFDATAIVKVGGKSCEVLSSDTNNISCKICPSETLATGVLHDVLVHIAEQGNARIEIEKIVDRTFVLLPLVTSLTPNEGSVIGGTKLTIQGSGFSDESSVLLNGWIPCELMDDETSYSIITCITTNANSATSASAVVVTEGFLTAECNASCDFAYTDTATPNITSWDHNENWANLEMTFNGNGFGSEVSGITIRLTSGELSASCITTSVNDTQIVCTLPRFAVGRNTISVTVAGKGNARFVSTPDYILNPALITSVNPINGSLEGGTNLVIEGNGFVDGDTSVVVGGVVCEVTSTSYSSVMCTTSPRSAASVNIVIRSNNINYPNRPYEYSDDVTPHVALVSPDEDSGGSTVVLTGSSFGTSVENVDVRIGGVTCEVQTVSNNQIDCVLGPREGGTASIEVHVSGKGNARIAANFTYVLEVTSASPLCGSYGGGQVITVDGEGFSGNTVVRICGDPCSVISNNPTSVQCATPPNNQSADGTTLCDLVVWNGNNFATLSSTYVYNNTKTPVVSSVFPGRGGTGGGTRLTITGTGFTSIDSPLSITIDGSTCDIATSNDTTIVCVTNEHRGTIKTQVEVKIGTSGVARQDSADFYYIDRWSSIFTWNGTFLPVDQDFVVIPKGQTVLLDIDTAVLTLLLIDGGELIFDEQDVTLSAENILITNGGRLQIGTEENPHQSKANIVMYGHLRSPELPIYGAKTLGVRNGTLEMHGRHIPHPWTKLSATAPPGSTQIQLEKSVNWLVEDYIVIASTGHRHSQNQNEKRRIESISPDGFTLTLNEALEYEHLGVTETFGGVPVEFRAEVGLLSRNIVFRGSNNHVWNDVIPRCEEGFDTGQFATQTCFQGRFGEEIGNDQFGASIMIHSKYPNTQEAKAYIENVEITYAGQAFRLGRYPVHWHLMGDVSGQYIRRCAVHQTFNRAITIHGTSNLTCDSNLVYDIMGGAIFIEDGIETGNVIQYNLAVFVRQSTSLLNDDVTPAAYWVTNPDNIIRHNHAAGGTHFGFWYRIHEHPDGPSFDPNICQRHVELGEFFNNTVHSQGWFGLWIFETYFPMEGGGCDATVPSPAKFRSLTTWRCEKGAEWVNCGAIQFIDFVMVNNEKAGLEIKLVKRTPWGEEQGALIKNAVIVGHSDQEDSSFETDVAIVLPMAPGLYINGASFFNFDRGGVIFEVTSIQGLCVVDCGGFYYWTEGLSFESVTKKLRWRWLHEGVIVDRDGSLTDRTSMSKVVPYSGIFDITDCPIFPSSDLSVGLPSSVCDPDIRFHRFALNNPLPSSLEANKLFFYNQHGNTSSIYKKKRLTHKPGDGGMVLSATSLNHSSTLKFSWKLTTICKPSLVQEGYPHHRFKAIGYMVLLQGKQDYLMEFDDGDQFTNITYNSKYYDFLENEYLFVSHRFKQLPDRIEINGQSRFEIGNTTILTPSSNNLDWSFDVDDKLFKFIVKGKDTSRKRREIEIDDPDYTHVSVTPTIYRCFYQDCIAPADPDDVPPAREKPENAILWSADPNPCLEWVGNHTVVVKRRTDEIDLCWVVVDVPTIYVDNITIEGVLQFENTDVNVSSIYILVTGGRIIAGFSKTEFFSNQLHIELRGNHDTPAWSLPEVELGSKALGCFGGCDFNGRPHNVYWTHLESTAMAGSNQIVLVDAVDWEVGNEIVITTTGYRSQETEKHVIATINADQKTITLAQSLQHRHLGASYQAGSLQYEMRAEVGLLSRNIKITGQSYEDIIDEAFGARVLVGSIMDTEGNFVRGWARLSNVEFFQTGQEGWTESWDPRFSLAWVDTGATSNARPSFVSGCAFHDGFSTAIGIFGADLINVTDNVVHRTIHDGIRITGSRHRVERNLVTVTLFRGSYNDRFEVTNFEDWQASFELSEANQLILRGNTAAGSERLGFHFDGEACDAPEDDVWRDNTAHGCLHGVHIFKTDGVGTCSMIRNFAIYKSWDFCIYHQTSVSIVVKNTQLIDCQVGYFSVIFSPAANTHQYANKSASLIDVLCVGRSDDFDPTLDFMDEENDKNLLVRSAGPSRKAPSTPSGGKMCVMLPLFESSANGAPFKAFHLNQDYPALHGLLNIEGFHAHRFMTNGDGSRDLIFFTNPSNEDAYFPTYISGFSFSEIERSSMIFLERPSLGKVNPSDCVDMECDAKKKVLVKDFDGGFLGQPGAIISQAEFAWDDPDEIQRGLGDYRIPKTLLTRRDGSRIPVEDIIDARGIVRSDSCEYVADWQAYNCSGEGTLDYRMLVIESLDGDSETRRLSPVALLGNRYIDLNNGPQDHGWCFGYTCQLRLSAFYTIIATGLHFDIYFTGVTPQNLRLHLLNVDNTESVRVAIWYSRPERLDVIRAESETYIHPNNSYYDVENDFWGLNPVTIDNVNSFKPPIDSPVNGANFFDSFNQLLYVTIRGNEPIDIKTVPAVIIAFRMPAVLLDDFFEVNLINNLANSEPATVSIQISDEIMNSSAANNSDSTTLTPNDLNHAGDMVLEAFQTGTLSSTLNTTIEGFSSTKAVENATAENLEEPEVTNRVEHRVPSAMNLTLLTTVTEEYLEFATPPCVTLLDDQGERVHEVGGDWTVIAELFDLGSSGGNLVGETEVMFEEAKATFSDLKITRAGFYNLVFTVFNPNNVLLSSESVFIEVEERQVFVSVVSPEFQLLEAGENATFTIALLNSNGEQLEAVGFKGHVWEADVLITTAAFGESIGGVTSFTFATGSAVLDVTGFTIENPNGNVNYTFDIRVYTEPQLHSIVVTSTYVQFNVTTNDTVIGEEPPELECPDGDFTDHNIAKELWLCDYVRWKLDFVFVWKAAVEQWRNFTSHEIAYEVPNPDCDRLQVTCANNGQWGVVEDPHGCFIPYCLDGYYESGPGFNHWKNDYKKWQKTFHRWRKLLKDYKEEICRNKDLIVKKGPFGGKKRGHHSFCD